MTAKEIKENNRKRLEAKRNQLTSGSESVKNVKNLMASISELSIALKDIQESLSSTAKAVSSPPKIVAPEIDIQPIADAVNAMTMNPIVNVSSPQVNVPKISTAKLESIVSDLKTTKLELEDFKAQDINNEEIGVQYIGFVHPSGAWYIIKNEIEENKMRYKFGKSDYEKSFAIPDNYEYTTLDRAIYEIQA